MSLLFQSSWQPFRILSSRANTTKAEQSRVTSNIEERNFGRYTTSTPCRYFVSFQSQNSWQGLRILSSRANTTNPKQSFGFVWGLVFAGRLGQEPWTVRQCLVDSLLLRILIRRALCTKIFPSLFIFYFNKIFLNRLSYSPFIYIFIQTICRFEPISNLFISPT